LDAFTEMSRGYQPLASYGASSGVHVQEARFAPGAHDADLIEAARLGARYIRPADGFQSLIYMDDGRAGRVLAFWRDGHTMRRFHEEVRPRLNAYEEQHWPQSPWHTHLLDISDGTATPHLIGPRMTIDNNDIVVWNPPAALLVCDITGVRDPRPLVDWWSQAAPSSGRSTWRDQPGFMFFSACDFDVQRISVYAGFQSRDNLDAFMSTPFYNEWHDGTRALLDSQRATHNTTQGRLLTWFIKEIR
jgi:hypothetical protein